MSRAARVLSLARNRQGIQRFSDRPVPVDLLECVLECGRYAPSAGEAQPWRFVVVLDALTRHHIASAAFSHPLVRSAPVLVLCCARIHTHVSGNGRPSHPIDLAAAAQNIALAGADLGLATGWITAFREREVQERTGIPSDVPIVVILALGYPESLERLPDRQSVDEVVAWERWEDPARVRGSA